MHPHSSARAREPAARPDLGLKRANVALGEHDPRLDILEPGALRRDPQGDQVAAKRRAGEGGDHEQGSGSCGYSLQGGP